MDKCCIKFLQYRRHSMTECQVLMKVIIWQFNIKLSESILQTINITFVALMFQVRSWGRSPRLGRVLRDWSRCCRERNFDQALSAGHRQTVEGHGLRRMEGQKRGPKTCSGEVSIINKISYNHLLFLVVGCHNGILSFVNKCLPKH